MSNKCHYDSKVLNIILTLSLTELLCKSMNWFLYDRDLRYERVRVNENKITCDFLKVTKTVFLYKWIKTRLKPFDKNPYFSRVRSFPLLCVNHFGKTLHQRSLIGFKLCLCKLSSKPKTIYQQLLTAGNKGRVTKWYIVPS